MKIKPIPLLLTVLSLCIPSQIFGQANNPAADPFLKSNQPPPAPPAPPAPAAAAAAGSGAVAASTLPREALVRMEVFTLPLVEGRTVTRKFPQPAELHAWLGGELEKEKSSVKLERIMVLRVRGGQRSKLEEIAEYPYPTEINAPEVPLTIGIGQSAPAVSNVEATPPAPVPPQPSPSTPGAQGETGPPGTAAPPATRPPGSHPPGTVFAPWPYTSATPQAFTRKNTGWTFEIELTIADDGQSVDLNMAPEFVRLCGLESQSPNGEVMQPNFGSSKIAAQVLTKFGKPTLVGTISPAVGTGIAGGNTEPLARLLFITVTDPR